MLNASSNGWAQGLVLPSKPAQVHLLGLTMRCGVARVDHTPALPHFGLDQGCKGTVTSTRLAKGVELELVDGVGDANLRHGPDGCMRCTLAPLCAQLPAEL